MKALTYAKSIAIRGVRELDAILYNCVFPSATEMCVSKYFT